MAEGYPPNLKKNLLLHFLNLFQLKQLSHDHMVIVMQMLILPMLAHAFQNGQTWEVIDAATIKIIVDKLLDPPEEVHSAFIFDLLVLWIFPALAFSFFYVCVCVDVRGFELVNCWA